MDSLHVELDAPDAPVARTVVFDELQPLVIDTPRVEVSRGKPRAATQIVVSREACLLQDRMHGSASAAAIGRERGVDQRLGAVYAARNRNGPRGGDFANG